MDSEPKPYEEESTESFQKNKKNLHFREIKITLLQKQSEKYLQ